MNYDTAAQQVAAHVTAMFEAAGSPRYPYHNLAHTKAVVAHALEIAAHYPLEAEDVFVLTAAAWFHDTGQLYGGMVGHEEVSVQKMTDHARAAGWGEELTLQVAQCILATRLPAHPATLLEYIICDADTYHFGTPHFRETDVLMKMEVQQRTGKQPGNWTEGSIRLLMEHQFYTTYCRLRLNVGKQENIRWLTTL